MAPSYRPTEYLFRPKQRAAAFAAHPPDGTPHGSIVVSAASLKDKPWMVMLVMGSDIVELAEISVCSLPATSPMEASGPGLPSVVFGMR
jgi:hypothetical protein